METIDFIIKKYKIDLSKESPFEINCCRLTELPGLLKELGFTTAVEVGVLDGVYSEILCKSNPELKVFSVDAWKFYPTRNNFRHQRHCDKHFEETKRVLSQYPNSVIVRKWSMDAVKDFADESLDFVFIDANHDFEHVTEDIAQWGKKVKKGGILSGHDFDDHRNKSAFCSVSEVVRAWTRAKRIHPWFVLKSKIDPAGPSWMWVKQ
jgi:hypothetical protein